MTSRDSSELKCVTAAKETLRTEIRVVATDLAGVEKLMQSGDTRLSERLDAMEKFFIAQLNSAKENAALALSAAEKATTKAEIAERDKFEGYNKFNDRAREERLSLATKGEVEALKETIAAVEKTLGGRIDVQAASIDSTVSTLDGRVSLMDKQSANKTGRFEGANILWGFIAWVLGVGVVIVADFMRSGVPH